jgi:Asp-tRNA(Asn)/Glu-tRNA(Gln) amidotransferase A subunit family amidase
LQLIAGPGRDELILSAAIAFQASTAWHRIRPAVRE